MTSKTRTSTKRALIAGAVAILLASLLASASPAAAATADRVGGVNRYDTAAAVSQLLNSCVVAIANGESFPDGLTGSIFGVPILLTRTDSMPNETVAELDRLDTACGGLDRILVLGGTAAVSSAVEDELQGYGAVPERIAGANRYETAVEVARLYDNDVGIQNKTVGLTTGADFPDALAVGAAAAKGGNPILLNDGATLRPEVADFLQDKAIEVVYILGGAAAVPETVKEQLETELGVIVYRLAGADRFETAMAIANAAYPGGASCVLLVNGYSFADALAAAPLGTFADCAVLLTNADSLPNLTVAWLGFHSGVIGDIAAIGGTAAVSDETLFAAALVAT